jgi:hypothetical protein
LEIGPKRWLLLLYLHRLLRLHLLLHLLQLHLLLHLLLHDVSIVLLRSCRSDERGLVCLVPF